MVGKARALMASSSCALALVALAGCTQGSMESVSVQSTGAAVVAPVASGSEASELDLADILSRMSLERKVAQLIQPQINTTTPEEMRKYRWGSYLNGGNGGPFGDEFAPASEWLRLADAMWDATTAPLPDGEPAIPTIWGTDAVHGHTNVIGATIFPHNIALGATGDPDLVRFVGAATGTEIEITGFDWNFSPTVAVARDDRWGRTYESYSEDPEIVAKMGAAGVRDLLSTVDMDDVMACEENIEVEDELQRVGCTPPFTPVKSKLTQQPAANSPADPYHNFEYDLADELGAWGDC